MSSPTPFKSADFVLDTSMMSEVAEKCERVAKTMSTLKQDLDNAKVKVLESWSGDGSDMFNKKFHYLVQQLKDISENLYDLAEGIRSAEDAYIQADMDMAKVMDGTSSLDG